MVVVAHREDTRELEGEEGKVATMKCEWWDVARWSGSARRRSQKRSYLHSMVRKFLYSFSFFSSFEHMLACSCNFRGPPCASAATSRQRFSSPNSAEAAVISFWLCHRLQLLLLFFFWMVILFKGLQTPEFPRCQRSETSLRVFVWIKNSL